MIKSFLHRGLERFFATGSKAGIQPKHAARLGEQLTVLNVAEKPSDMAIFPGWNLHPLKGELRAHWSISVSGNWRLTFVFQGVDVILVDYQDYH